MGRAAKAIEAGDLCLAGIETVLLRLPDLTPQALAKLAEVADLEKGGTAWQDEPRVPAGQPDGGQWTTADGAGGAPTVPAKPAAAVSPHALAPRPEPPLPLDDGVYRPGATTRTSSWLAARRKRRSRAGRTGRRTITRRLEDVFPGLKEAPGLAIPLAPIDGFLGFSAAADEADAEVVWGEYWGLIHQIKQVDPTFKDEELFPPGKIDGLTRQGRTNLINHLRMVRAAAYYRMRGEVGFLQVETLRFLQDAVDAAYAEAVAAADAGRLRPRLSREEAIGNWIDLRVRADLRQCSHPTVSSTVRARTLSSTIATTRLWRRPTL